MSLAPRFFWDEIEVRRRPMGGRVVWVPVQLGALSFGARELLVVRLRRRCLVSAVALEERPTDAVLFGVALDRVDGEFRLKADHALQTVAADSAAGWTSHDEATLPGQ